jgi:hypothetical protein
MNWKNGFMSSNTCSALFPLGVVSKLKVKNRYRLGSGGLRSFPLSLKRFLKVKLNYCKIKE